MPAKNFALQELLPSSMCQNVTVNSWSVFDSRLLSTIDAIREVLGYKMICNTWFFSKASQATYGLYEYRGFRPKDCGVGTITGAHYKGMAIDFDAYDLKGVRIPSKTIIDLILKRRYKFPYIIGLETNVAWNHVDVMDGKVSPARVGVPKGKILLFDANNNSRLV